jgi:hypothetical protein
MKIELFPGTDPSPQVVLAAAMELVAAGKLKEVIVMGFDENGEAVSSHSTMTHSDMAYLSLGLSQKVAKILFEP